MRYRLPPLNTLRLFEASARLLSFKRAAEELSITPSAVSHGVQTLEHWLGVRLFVRTKHGIVLSESGRSYYPAVREALALISNSSDRLTGSAARRLVLSVAPTFAARWLLPRLPDFRARHPEIAVVIDTAQAQVDLTRREVDLAIRMGHGQWKGCFIDHIFTEYLVPVCAPDFLDHVRAAASLDELPLIHVTRAREEWATWARAAGHTPPDPARGLNFDTLQMAFSAAAEGLGVAMGRRPLIDAELEAARLVVAAEPAVESSTGYWLVGLQSGAGDQDVQAFRDWLAYQRTPNCT
ncbi:transcriptional regulator GcvA [Halomonas cerina]|uniref:DNA-binding transcriptional LysR family regulator n=1 Tax=Halomonas cerina TaxID=447424 RepID=A0A839V941_9GAMM|nr:transcriptional regulator GcvA [Halomonas cerina]MBB3189989.1 DNA-binding transcriptional LysR family regulator [Halomonas cerina]